ncbi:FecCD family ABC transporter permease [Corynebacterium uterequi]|uniref:ABC-type Fe3+-siderophore transport system, permease component n=1 Tax=Corynebacterium uterequi TaxID=1072256 RepID=A0A0G3HGW4_9CORY|nr:iron ABC transporter permease [Corynebacterium uterequi]AKK12020.1 ABC-type Fe3+-siderophore transport system, permease component [Corynebacterium uterequi]
MSRRNPTAVVALLLCATVVVAACSLAYGSRDTAVAEVIGALRGEGDAEVLNIVWNLRIPRTLLAFFVGASLAVAGALAQAWTRNPLADPGFIGVTAGASFFVAAGTVLGVASFGLSRVLLALAGASITAAVVVGISRRSPDPLTLVLVGLGLSAALQASSTLVGLFSNEALDALRRWTVGATFGRGYDDVAIAALGCVIGMVIAAVGARPLDLLAMGEETSLALGGSPAVARMCAALGVVVLAGTATAAAGPTAFVGFAAPHIMRRILGPSLSRSLVPTALCGGIIVLAADIVGRLVLQPGELEMSIVVSILGAPALIWAVHRGVGWQKEAAL